MLILKDKFQTKMIFHNPLTYLWKPIYQELCFQNAWKLYAVFASNLTIKAISGRWKCSFLRPRQYISVFDIILVLSTIFHKLFFKTFFLHFFSITRISRILPVYCYWSCCERSIFIQKGKIWVTELYFACTFSLPDSTKQHLSLEITLEMFCCCFICSSFFFVSYTPQFE